MSLYRVGDLWYLDITHNGRRDRRSTGTTDKKAAQEYHDRIKAENWRTTKLGDSPSRHWFDAIGLWLLESERDPSDKYRLAVLKRKLGNPPLAQITQESLDEALKGQKPSSYNRYLQLVHAVLALAASKRKWLTAVPKFERKSVDDQRVRWLTKEEWDKLRKQLPDYLREMAQFALATGLRENNVIGLQWSQVDLKRATAWIHPDQAKAGKAIGIPLNDDAMAVLAVRRTACDKEEEKTGQEQPTVFRQLYKTSNRAWYEALKAAGLKGFRWHDLRHTWASWHVMGGTRLEELQKLGGWKTLAMVTRYAHLDSGHLARVANNAKPVSLRHKSAIPRKAKHL